MPHRCSGCFSLSRPARTRETRAASLQPCCRQEDAACLGKQLSTCLRRCSPPRSPAVPGRAGGRGGGLRSPGAARRGGLPRAAQPFSELRLTFGSVLPFFTDKLLQGVRRLKCLSRLLACTHERIHRQCCLRVLSRSSSDSL